MMENQDLKVIDSRLTCLGSRDGKSIEWSPGIDDSQTIDTTLDPLGIVDSNNLDLGRRSRRDLERVMSDTKVLTSEAVGSKERKMLEDVEMRLEKVRKGEGVLGREAIDELVKSLQS